MWPPTVGASHSCCVFCFSHLRNFLFSLAKSTLCLERNVCLFNKAFLWKIVTLGLSTSFPSPCPIVSFHSIIMKYDSHCCWTSLLHLSADQFLQLIDSVPLASGLGIWFRSHQSLCLIASEFHWIGPRVVFRRKYRQSKSFWLIGKYWDNDVLCLGKNIHKTGDAIRHPLLLHRVSHLFALGKNEASTQRERTRRGKARRESPVWILEPGLWSQLNQFNRPTNYFCLS